MRGCPNWTPPRLKISFIISQSPKKTRPRGTTLFKKTYLRKQLTLIMNKFDGLNPLYTNQITLNEDDNSKDNSKTTKRSEKTTREVILKTSKDTNDAMEVKMNEIGMAVNDNVDKKLNEGFDKLTNQISELVNFLKENNKNKDTKVDNSENETTEKDNEKKHLDYQHIFQ